LKPTADIAAAIARATAHISEAIQDRLEEVNSMRLDADLAASDLMHTMRERTARLKAHVDSHARQCAVIENQINGAGKDLGGAFDTAGARAQTK
jgi:hypothetical protein